MKVLIVKMSSMGDVIHTLPAVSDAVRKMPGIEIDWVVEEAFAEISSWHPAIRRVIPVAIRRWRSELFPPWKMRSHGAQWRNFKQALQQEKYDLVIDAQGLIKSAIIARLARGVIAGFDSNSAREPLASLAYGKHYYVSKDQHAIERTRQLFAQALGYSLENTPVSGGLARSDFGKDDPRQFSVMFLHGTTRDDKHWPEVQWMTLAQQLAAAGIAIRIPWYNDAEKQRAERIAQVSAHVEVLPRSTLKKLAQELAKSTAFVAVDTGLGHLGAALNVPGLSLYGPTDPARIGTYGISQLHLRGTTMSDITAKQAFEKLRVLFPRAC
jgi:heptosyltransferase-1